jgi:hypothetical protein
MGEQPNGVDRFGVPNRIPSNTRILSLSRRVFSIVANWPLITSLASFTCSADSNPLP